eukprot:1160019-Prymnesium_polylepis.1
MVRIHAPLHSVPELKRPRLSGSWTPVRDGEGSSLSRLSYGCAPPRASWRARTGTSPSRKTVACWRRERPDDRRLCPQHNARRHSPP